jgi:hypothetical protein
MGSFVQFLFSTTRQKQPGAGALVAHLTSARVTASIEVKILLAATLMVQVWANGASAQTTTAPQAHAPGPLIVVVTDENGVAVAGARVTMESAASSLRCETDLAGRCTLAGLNEASWQLRVEKETYYVFTMPDVQTSGTLEIALSHQQELRETVNVSESPPAIDPAQVSAQEQLSGIDIINIPYPTTRDYRYVLSYIPGVVLDLSAQPHIEGGEASQTLTLLDGFNVTQPASGQLLARVSTDALRSVQVETSRISAEYGKGAAGILKLGTGIGDDHYRFAATNFLPSFQNKKGWTLDKVDPRFTLSGPINRGRAWFFDAVDGEYDNVIIRELPAGEDTDTVWRTSNLAKVQVNATTRDIVTASFLLNRLHDNHLGFSTLAPASTRPEDSESLYFGAFKEQHAFSEESLVEVGLAFSQYGVDQRPEGSAPYVLTPEIALGSYYLNAHTIARRAQGIANWYLPKHWHGRHDLTLGLDFDRLIYEQVFQRSTLSSTRDCPVGPSTCDPTALRSTFSGGAPATVYNTETSAYIQDRWSPTSHLLIEPGVRFDWDEIVRRPLISPRLAGTYLVDGSGNTKISAGVGVVYQATPLALIAQPFQGARQDTFFAVNGTPTSFSTTFSVNRNDLLAPRFINWSIALEQKLPAQLFLKTEFMRRTGIHDFVYNTAGSTAKTNFVLQNTRNDEYYAWRIDLRRTFKQRYILTGSYTRSSSRSNQVLDYSLDNLVLNPQVPGPFAWDVPNRFISWGWFPLIRGFDAGYSFDARTGFPFSAFNDQQQIVRPPGSYRYPSYIALNLHLEKRFHALGFYWALRGGFDNITNHQNPFTVNNDIASPQFLTFSNFDRRAFTARIRFLGRK